jgi:hypothetical protein
MKGRTPLQAFKDGLPKHTDKKEERLKTAA